MIGRIGVLSCAVIIAAAPAALGVAPGTVEVRNELGVAMSTLTGPDAIQDAVGAVITARAPESLAWSLAIGAGTYGDVPVYYVGRDQFVKNKRATGRQKDRADIEALGDV